MSNPRKSRGIIRPASVTQVAETSRGLHSRIARNRLIHPADTAPGRTAREWFTFLKPQLLASIPRELCPHPHMKNGRGKPVMVAVATGPATFRNVMVDGKLV